MTEATSIASSTPYVDPEAAFAVSDMTSLRYGIPFIKKCRELLGQNVPLIIDESASPGKYNSIQRWRPRLIEILSENSIDYMWRKDFTRSVRRLFCVENVSQGIPHDVCYSFQHGFDFEGLHRNVSRSTYLVTETYFKERLESLGHVAVVQPYPVVFWDWENTIEHAFKRGVLDTRKSATLFYPESGLHSEFQQVYGELDRRGFITHVKQRAKNQSIPTYVSSPHYDIDWYPSESIYLPVSSDVSVGFGTSAYTDLIHLKRHFIDLAVPEYSRRYYKPTVSHFSLVLSDYVQGFYTAIEKCVFLKEKRERPFSIEAVHDFLKKVFDE